MRKTVQIVKYSALAVVVALAAGCASSETTKAVEDNQRAVAQATDLANQANRAAAEASRKADAAMRAAQDAKSCCESNSERVSRAFEKSMRK
ncbi:putative Major outer membrane lipoprotein [Gammaproteobacteria bacterium]